MKKIRIISLITTISDAVFLLISILAIAAGVCFMNDAENFFNLSEDNLNSLNSENVTAGYQAVADIAGLGAGFMGMALGLAMIVISSALAFCFIIPTITGIAINSGKKKRRKNFTADGIVKIIFNAMPAGAVLLLLIDRGIEDMEWTVVIIFSLLTVIVLMSVIQIVLAHKEIKKRGVKIDTEACK